MKDKEKPSEVAASEGQNGKRVSVAAGKTSIRYDGALQPVKGDEQGPTEGKRRDADADPLWGRAAAGAAPVSLPCLSSDNCIQNHTQRSLDEALRAAGATPLERIFDRYGREWNGEQWGPTAAAYDRAIEEAEEQGAASFGISDDDWSKIQTPADRKRAWSVFKNSQYLIDRHGLQKIGFLTLTFAENLTDFREAQRRFHSLATNFLRDLFDDWMVVVEPQKRGAVHYHLLVVCGADIRTGFDFEALERRDYSSASPYLRGLWQSLREGMSRYGFGRSELLPIKSTAEGAARYVGKYIGKGSRYRGDQFKGARMVRYSQGWRAVGSRFSWVDGGVRWRSLLAEVARVGGLDTLDDFTARYGRYWARKLLQILEADSDPSPILCLMVLGQGR